MESRLKELGIFGHGSQPGRPQPESSNELWLYFHTQSVAYRTGPGPRLGFSGSALWPPAVLGTREMASGWKPRGGLLFLSRLLDLVPQFPHY